jgi:hypothetical protein
VPRPSSSRPGTSSRPECSGSRTVLSPPARASSVASGRPRRPSPGARPGTRRPPGWRFRSAPGAAGTGDSPASPALESGRRVECRLQRRTVTPGPAHAGPEIPDHATESQIEPTFGRDPGLRPSAASVLSSDRFATPRASPPRGPGSNVTERPEWSIGRRIVKVTDLGRGLPVRTGRVGAAQPGKQSASCAVAARPATGDMPDSTPTVAGLSRASCP